jgi:hypothetical protein
MNAEKRFLLRSELPLLVGILTYLNVVEKFAT